MDSTIAFEIGGGVFGEKKISVNIVKVGREYCDPKKKREHRKWAELASLHFVLYGKGTLIANGKELHLSKGDVFMLFAREEYEYYPDPADPWSYVWVDFISDNTKALCAPCELTPQSPTMHLSRMSSLMGLLDAIYEAYDASNLQQLSCSGYFMLLLCELIRASVHDKSKTVFSTVGHRHIRDIIIYINNNFRLPLTNQKIAGENHISVSRMLALFAEVVGLSPIAYLNKFRISTACELLHSTDLTIREVANAVGMEDQLYFSRLFKKQKGMSPRAYRMKAIEEDPFGWLKEKNIDFK